MRNLKRALSLALASVMLLGMMVVGAGAASYPDVDDNDNVEAIDVLNAVEVMIGRQGNFEPDEAVNRHEMAVIMAKLVLGVETADNYVGTHPFTDVVPWADKYVAACYENGLIAGTSATTYGGGQPLTAVQAAAMMLRALGYKDLSKGATDWRAPVTATANQIRLFNGVASIPSEQLNRNQVAQLALNTLKSSVVDLKDNTLNLTNEDGKVIVTGGSREYIVRSSYESYARAINNTETAGTSASSVSGYTIELGEHLYNGKLRLTNDVDEFGRPSRVWEYDGKDIGTYVREDLLRDSYTVSVKGSDVYDDLGTVSIRDSELLVYIDGVPSTSITKNHLVRTWRENLSGTGKGVLTQVFYDYEKKTVTITEINTYLAEVKSDYDEKTDRGSLDVYGYNGPAKARRAQWVDPMDNKHKNTVAPYSNIKSDDLPGIVDTKDGDFVLVTIADGDLMTIEPAQVLENQEITSLKVADWVNTGSQKYEFSAAYDYNFAKYLTTWDIINMEDATYNLYMDKYGYAVGADLYAGTKNYVFITGYDRNGSNISDSTISASAIFTDGTRATIKVDAGKSDPSKGGTTWNTGAATDAHQWSDPGNGEGVITNKWYTYSVNSKDVYTLKLAKQVWDDGTAHDGKINAARNGLAGSRGNDVAIPANYYRPGSSAVPATDHTTTQYVYGDTETNYIIVDPEKNIKKMGVSGNETSGISGVTTTVTGVRNVDIEVYDATEVVAAPYSQQVYGRTQAATYGAYAVYDDDYHIVAAVVVGVDSGANNNYVYLTKGTPNEEAIRKDSEGNWYWTFDVITKDEGLTTKTFKGEYNTLFQNIGNNNKGLYQVSYDKDGYITEANWLAYHTFVKNAYAPGWDNHLNNKKVAYEPEDIVYASSDDTVPTLAWCTSQELYANGRTLNDKSLSDMYGVHLAPNAKIYTNQRINDGWDTREHSSLASAVNALTYNGSTVDTYAPRRVYALLNNNGEADVLVIEIERNFNTNQQGSFVTSGVLQIDGLTFNSVTGATVNYTNKSTAYFVAADTAVIEIKTTDGTLVYRGNATAVGATPANAAGTVTFGNYKSTPTNLGKYTVELTIYDASDSNKPYTGKATLGTT